MACVFCNEQAQHARPLHRMGTPSPNPNPPTSPLAAPLSAAVLVQYKTARLGIAVAPEPAGPYVYLRSFQPHGEESRDFTVFQARALPCSWRVYRPGPVAGALLVSAYHKECTATRGLGDLIASNLIRRDMMFCEQGVCLKKQRGFGLPGSSPL